MLKEDHKEVASGKKKDDEGYMARTELDAIEKAVKNLKKTIKKGDQQLPAWVQSKITRAADYIDTAAEYLDTDETVDESRDPSFEIPNRKPAGLRRMTKDQAERHSNLAAKKHKEERAKVDLPKLKESLVDKILSEIQEEKDPKGPTKPYKTPKEIAKLHNVPLRKIQNQLKIGIDVEYEHTTSRAQARITALQHLEEIPDYYTRLKKMETQAESYELEEGTASGDSSLHDWFNKSKSSDGTKGWVQLGGPYAGKPCARQPGQKSTPKCGSSKMAKELTAKEEERAFRRKNRKDPDQPEKTGGAKPTYVKTESFVYEEKGKKRDACYYKVKARYKVWPSAYASGALVKCRKERGLDEAVRLATQNGNLLSVVLMWRGKYYSVRTFFPQVRMPSRQEVNNEMQKLYPGCRIVSFTQATLDPNQPIIQIQNSKSKNYLLNNQTIGESVEVDEDWQSINRKDRTDGLSPKAVKAYRRENPGSKLQTAVTEKKPEGKRAKRRASFCRRMKGMKNKLTSAKTARDPDSRINKALRRWRCE